MASPSTFVVFPVLQLALLFGALLGGAVAWRGAFVDPRSLTAHRCIMSDLACFPRILLLLLVFAHGLGAQQAGQFPCPPSPPLERPILERPITGGSGNGGEASRPKGPITGRPAVSPASGDPIGGGYDSTGCQGEADLLIDPSLKHYDTNGELLPNGQSRTIAWTHQTLTLAQGLKEGQVDPGREPARIGDNIPIYPRPWPVHWPEPRMAPCPPAEVCACGECGFCDPGPSIGAPSPGFAPQRLTFVPPSNTGQVHSAISYPAGAGYFFHRRHSGGPNGSLLGSQDIRFVDGTVHVLERYTGPVSGASIPWRITKRIDASDNLTLYLVQGFTGALGDDLDTDDDGTLDSAPWTQVADCVSIIETPGSGDLVYCSTQVGPDGSFPPSQIERCPDEMGVFVIGEADATLLLDTPGAANGCTAPPPNDECSGALTITDGINDIWTASATDSADAAPTGCTNFFGMMLQDAWFTYTASGDGTLTIDTSGSAFDTDAALYDGSCGALNLLACDGDGGGVNFSSLVSAPVTAGTEYILRIGGWGTGEAGDGLLTVSFVAAGDECDNAIPAVDGLNPFDTTPYTNSADASDASQCTGTFLGDLVNDGWWTFVPSIDGTMDVTTVGLTTVDTDLVIYEGACGSLTQLACNGDAGPLQSEVLGLPVTAGTTYTLRIGGWETGEFGTGEFEITVTPIAVAPTASFSISPLQAIAPLEATLIDASDDGMDAGATIEINWGDMTTDSGLAPGSSAMHTYGPGTYTVAVTITNTAGSDTAMSMPIEAVAMGDCDLSGMADVADAVSLAEYLFSGAAAPACDAACDVNGDGVLDLGDVVYMLLWQFAGGTAPVQPAPNSGC